MRSRLLVLALLVALSACDYTEPSRIVGGVDLDVLFAPATRAEIDSVKADWAMRDVSAQSVRIEYLRSATVEEQAVQVMIVSHRVAGIRHMGAIVFPDGADPSSLPVFIYLHGGDGGISVDDEALPLYGVFQALAGDFVMVIPSFRDESVRYDGRTFTSEGSPSPWDYDVDDAMALLSVSFDVAPAADPTRVAAVGLSRGAGVALLMAARDDRLDRVVEFFGPTDFFGSFVQDVVEEILSGTPRELPGVDYLSDTYVLPLSEGDITMHDARIELARRSAVLFVDDMPPVQLHHGTADSIVPVSQAQSLIRAMDRAGKPESEFESYLYEGGEHNPFTLTDSFDRTMTFLAPLTGGS